MKPSYFEDRKYYLSADAPYETQRWMPGDGSSMFPPPGREYDCSPHHEQPDHSASLTHNFLNALRPSTQRHSIPSRRTRRPFLSAATMASPLIRHPDPASRPPSQTSSDTIHVAPHDALPPSALRNIYHASDHAIPMSSSPRSDQTSSGSDNSSSSDDDMDDSESSYGEEMNTPSPSPPAEPHDDPYHTTSFPPGKDDPGFIPFADPRTASVTQGNYWPISTFLRDKLFMSEVDGQGRRGTRLSYDQVFDKYTAWKGNVTTSTMRGQIRKLVLPPDKRRRKPVLDDTSREAMRRAVPNCKDHKGHILWNKVKKAIKSETDSSFGAAMLHKEWNAMQLKKPPGQASKSM